MSEIELTLTLFGAWLFVGPVLLWLQHRAIEHLRIQVRALWHGQAQQQHQIELLISHLNEVRKP